MRLVNAEKLENYAYEPEFGMRDMVENWIAETDIPADVKMEYEEELGELCWKVLKSCMNVIRTEPTAYNVDEVVEQLEKEGRESVLVTLKAAYKVAIETIKKGMAE